MKCTNCGAELNGKFCTNCGTPAPAQETPVAETPASQPMATPSTDFPTFENMPLQSEAMPESTPVSQDNAQPLPYQSEPVNQTSGSYPAQPVQTNDFGSYQSMPSGQDINTNPFAQPTQSEYPVNNGYTGQQFTNVPNTNTAQGGKKKMSGGKIAIIVIAIVLGVLLLFGIVVGVIIWNVVNGVKSGIESGIESFESEYNSILDEDFDFDYDYDFDSSVNSDNVYVYDGDLEEYVYSTEEEYDDYGWQYVVDPEDSSKAIIVGINMYMAEDHISGKSFTLTVPETVDGYKIEQIYEMYVYNPGIDELEVKLVVPGHIKTVHDCAFEYSEDCLTEVVFEEGVESIGEEAIFRCDKIKKITVPESVKLIGDNALGFTYDSNYEVKPVDGVTIVTKKNSTADVYAKQHNIKVEYN